MGLRAAAVAQVVPDERPPMTLAGAAATADAIHDEILARVDPASVVRMSHQDLAARVEQLAAEIANRNKLLLNQSEYFGTA